MNEKIRRVNVRLCVLLYFNVFICLYSVIDSIWVFLGILLFIINIMLNLFMVCVKFKFNVIIMGVLFKGSIIFINVLKVENFSVFVIFK